MKKLKYKFLALIVAIAQLLSLSAVTVAANPDDEPAMQIEDVISEESVSLNNDVSDGDASAVSERKLTPIVSAQKMAAGEPIIVSFNNANIASYYYIADGVAVTEDSDNSMQFALTPTEEFGSFDVYAECENGGLAKGSLYIYKYGDTVYISDVAKDQAWYDCTKEQYEAGLITLEEWQAAYSVLSQTFVARDETQANASNAVASAAASDISPASISNNITISGALMWEIDAAGNKLPLRLTKVELRVQDTAGSRCVATGYTDGNGNYSFTFENSDDWDLFESGEMDLFIRVILESETLRVAPDWLITIYYADTSIANLVRNGMTTGFGHYIPYDEGKLAFKATYVQQGMIVGQRFAKAMGMVTSNFVHVTFPSEIEFLKKTGFCWGGDEEGCVCVIGAERYKDIDALIHEYGHFVEASLGNFHCNLVDYFSNGADHTASDDHFVDKEDKAFAMYLTWSEAWATAFSLIAQDFYKTEYVGITGFADIKYGDTDYEKRDVGDNGGEAQEWAVTAVLWDLFDAVSTEESFDNVSLSYAPWWALTTRPGTYTLTDFVSVVESLYPSGRGAIGEIMAEYQISPGDLTITNAASVSASMPPKLSWTDGGSEENPNDRFEVVFYDNSGEYIYSTYKIEDTENETVSHSAENPYSVTTKVWEEVLKNYSGTVTINIAVRGYHTEDPISGPYLSKYIPITVHIHAYQYTYNDTSSHTSACDCGHTITEAHSYDECVYKDALNHIATCQCGYQRTTAHWVKPTSERYANCVECGALIDLGSTITPVNPFNTAKVSVNGSYLLPSGVAVIADADVEAYLNGTLVFYDPDDLPVTQ